MKQSATKKSIATFTAAALVLSLGIPTVNAADSKTAKLESSTQSHGYSDRGHGDRGYGGHSGQAGRDGYRGHGGYDNRSAHGGYNNGRHPSHSNGNHGYRPSYGSHRPQGYGNHASHGSYGHNRAPQHRGYYCSRCHYQTSSYSLFYNHVHHLHQVPWYDIASLITFDSVRLFFTFAGNTDHGGHGTRHAGHH